MYSFTPKLWPGDLVGGQYQVAGCIAHGGLGWIYLAQDKNVEDSWVVLKGLLDSGDESAMLAAATEKRFLAEVRHPNIVRIYNFVEHGGAGYIVMEYVGGESLRELRVRHREETGSPLPVDQAIAYVLEILPALGFLHRRGLLFCDFKPDNVIQTEEQLTLIDLGGVRRMDDQDSDLYGTVGYQAPEVPERGASIASDLYTVARTLAILSIEFAGFQDEKRYATSLPPVQDVPEFRRYESFHRFLQKATAAEPDLRFQSAAEMAEQLIGVLRQVVAVDGGQPGARTRARCSAPSWGPPPTRARGSSSRSRRSTPTTRRRASWPPWRSSVPTSARPWWRRPRGPSELSLNIAKSAIEDGAYDEAVRELESPEARSERLARRVVAGRAARGGGTSLRRPRVLRGRGGGAPRRARAEVGHGVVLRAGGPNRHAVRPVGRRRPAVTAHLHAAARYYALVAATDPGYASASFGLARVSMELGDREAAAAALQRVPKSSSAYVTAQVASCRVLCAPLPGDPPTVTDLAASSATLAGLSLENSVRLPLAARPAPAGSGHVARGAGRRR